MNNTTKNQDISDQVYPKNQFSENDDGRSLKTTVSVRSNHGHCVDKYSVIADNYKKADYSVRSSTARWY